MASELADAKRRIRGVESELTATKLASSMLKDEGTRAQGASRSIDALTGQGISTACQVLRVTDRGYWAWRDRPMSQRSIRHVMLVATIANINGASRGC